MSKTPVRPKLYHITHVDNLASIIADDALFSDAKMIERRGNTASIGMSKIKQRRLTLPVTCHASTNVGDFVPFYFCPRSIMLYVIHRADSPDLAYHGGQDPIVHLEADLHLVVEWAKTNKRRWCFSLSNAGATYTEFRSSVDELKDVKWAAVAAADFRDSAVKEGKQAEFLVHGSFPWSLVSRVGVRSAAVKLQAERAIEKATHKPQVTVEPNWYF